MSVERRPVDLLRRFLNTEVRSNGVIEREVLGTAADASAWAERAGLGPGPVAWSDDDAGALRALRAALRAHALGEAGSLAALDGALAELPLVVRALADGSLRLEPVGDGPRAVRARLAAALHEADRAGQWRDLKLCANPDCRMAFVDGSKSHSRTWCDMASCGSQAKTRAYRRRRAGTSGAPGGGPVA